MSIDASGTETVTDSGYGSCTQDKPTKQNTDLGQETRLYNEIENTDLENMKPIAGAEIDESVYSSTSSLSDASMSGYVFAIAEEISDAVSGSLVSEEMVDKICNALPRLLKGLSASIGSNATSQMHLDVMVFLRKYRRNITAICREIITERPSWKSRDDSENMSLTEKMSMWQGIKDEVMEPADHVALEGLDIDSADDDDDDDDYDYDDSSLEANLPGFEAYKSLVRSDPSYGKLIFDIFRECIVMSTLPNTLEEISNTITRILPASPRISRKVLPERFTMRFQVDWDPVTFLHEQQYSESPDIAIGQAIALTGSTVTVQALRCSEYLQQTWPSSGVNILKLIQEKVRPGYPNKSTGQSSHPGIDV
ncbi:hypothetical protein N7504_002950 [Penicillium tannophilum]|nr:hypothetical protein N7504_002950 [Penicillium tannophilum]